MRRSEGVSSFVATLILVTISLSLSYVVYQGVRGFSIGKGEDTFVNETTLIQGTPEILELSVNSSQPSTPLALEVASVTSEGGILYLSGSSYATTSSLCLAGGTTFFSVYASSPGLVQVTSNGQAWIDGHDSSALEVQSGWHEIMISDASSCEVSAPGVSSASYPSATVSSLPLIGAVPSSSFTFYLPTSGSQDALLIVFDGGTDQVA